MSAARRRLFLWPWELAAAGVLGMNRRNLDLILPRNPRSHYPRVDDKALTKAICQRAGIPVPETYAIVSRYGAIDDLQPLLASRPDFVVKPTRGAEGRGVLVVVRHDGRSYERPDGVALTWPEIHYHVATTLSGLYSLGGRPDTVLVEQRIVRHDAFAAVAVGGTPDIRVIVADGDPVMAMLRLPTTASRGRANLHQGAIGAGVDIQSGLTTGGVLHDQAVSVHPDTGAPITGMQVPFWEDVRCIAARLARALEMGYVGVDLVIDADRGPIVLEANARPGLAIQIANRRGLLRAITKPAPAEEAGPAGASPAGDRAPVAAPCAGGDPTS